MNLLNKKKSKKLSEAEVRKRERIASLAATTPNTINYTELHENGLMHIVENEYSKTYELGEIDYEIAGEDERVDTAVSYAQALNSLDKISRYQLLVLNRKIHNSVLDNFLLSYAADSNDNYRGEVNEIITEHFEHDQKNFEIKKYATFSTHSASVAQANRQLNTIVQNFEKRFNDADAELTITDLGYMGRLRLMNSMLRPSKKLNLNNQDILLSGLSEKAFISPNRLEFLENYFKIDNHFGKIIFIREYPQTLEDQLIHELCDSGHELAISIHAKPYDMVKAKKDIQNKQILNKAEIVKQQKENFKKGIPDDTISDLAMEVKKTTLDLVREMKEGGQKMYSGIFAVMLIEDSKEKLDNAVQDIQDIAATWQVEFDDIYQMQEEALNTMLPIGKPYLDVEMSYMRDMTTNNIATQIPFTTVELQSNTGQYYGQNQMSHSLITIDRKKDLNTPSGLILGSSGSGKGMTVKWEIILNRLRNPNDRLIIVDPESEYLPIAKAFGAQILDISAGTKNHLNILDMANVDLLDKEDRNENLVKEKTNLLASLFESVLKSFSDEEASIVDRVTRLTYEEFKTKNETPTLVDWYNILGRQPEEIAKAFYIKIEPYAIGAQNIFAHETNIDLTAPFIVFNIKQLDDRMKPFAMKVILDQIWKQVVENQGKKTTWLYFDELQLNFDTEENANWFWKLWSRVRKYGAIPTGITQNVSTLLEVSAGEKMISNSEFIILLRQKLVDLQHLRNVVSLTPELIKYVGEKVPKGTGLIYAGGTTVPFENPIPKSTDLYRLMNTDA